MKNLIIDRTKMTQNNGYLFNTLFPYWVENGWFDESQSSFNQDSLIQILNDVVNSTDSNSEVSDLLTSSLKVLENVDSGSKLTLNIGSNSYLGHKDFKYTTSGSGQSGAFIEFFRAYLEEESLSAKESLTRLHMAKKLKPILALLNIETTFEEELEKRQIAKVTKAFPLINSTGENDAQKYTLSYKLLLDTGETHDIVNTEFAADRGYLKIDSRYILFDNDMYPAISKQKKMANLGKTEASAFFSNPTQALFPSGTDTEKFDMSEYDARVASFEYAPRVKFREIVSSNIAWYDKEDIKVPYIQFKGENGQIVAVNISDDVLNELIPKMETSLNSGILLADGNARPVEDSEGNLIETSESNLNFLKSFRDLIKKEKNIVPENKTQNKGSIKVAVLREVDLPVCNEELETVQLSKEELEKFLNDGINLKPHQVDGVNWLVNAFLAKNGGVFLCDDMGLGKTIQLILFYTILQNLEQVEKLKKYMSTVSSEKPSLVVAPLILINNWEAEIKKFIKPQFTASVYKLHGSNLDSIKNADGSLYKDWWRNYSLILTNYNTFARYQVDLLRYKFLVTFFDESQNLKNPDIAASKAARGLSSDFVVCATGTPVEIRYLDLWSQMDSLKRRPNHPLGREEDFAKDYERHPDGPERLRNTIKINDAKGLMIRRDKALLRASGELLEREILEPYFVQMTPFQEAQEAFIVQKYKGKALKILQNLQKLYQHPYLLNEVAVETTVRAAVNDSPKLQKTLEILDSIKVKNEKVLVFTLWTGMQSLLQRVFKETYGIDVAVINGEVNAKAKNSARSPALDIIDNFSKKEGFNILILSPLAAGAGLNITAANHVLHYGRWWNPAKEDQSTDRAYRIGQKKKVFVHYPVLVTSKGEGFDKKLDQRVRERRQMAYDVLAPINSLDAENLLTDLSQEEA